MRTSQAVIHCTISPLTNKNAFTVPDRKDFRSTVVHPLSRFIWRPLKKKENVERTTRGRSWVIFSKLRAERDHVGRLRLSERSSSVRLWVIINSLKDMTLDSRDRVTMTTSEIVVDTYALEGVVNFCRSCDMRFWKAITIKNQLPKGPTILDQRKQI